MSQELFRRPCVFTAGAQNSSQLPSLNLPEVAFVGRSNVGKSSLINSLTYRKSLARTSRTPGRTTQINFFCLGDLFYLVDLPGYGYAETSKKTLSEWRTLIGFYLTERPLLKRVYILIDSRRGIGPKDQTMMEFLNAYAVSYQIILTKTDQLNFSQRQEVEQKTRKELQYQVAAYPEIISTTIQDQKTFHLLREAILMTVLPEKI